MSVLLDYFTRGTEGTVTGAKIGMEIETDFRNTRGAPITTEVSRALLRATQGRPAVCQQKLELGKQKIELSIAPQPTFALLMETVEESLNWLYGRAISYNARPLFAPEIGWDGNLLWVQEERDEVWVRLDGRPALEHLCRCSSVQFMIDVNPADAIAIINRAWSARLQLRDYGPNDARQRAYIESSHAKYRPDRYGGPVGFDDMADYVHELEKHAVVIHHGRPVRINVTEVPDLEVDLFLRSVWWHFRLRRFGNTLALEMRPFSRRRDEDIPTLWKDVAKAIGL